MEFVTADEIRARRPAPTPKPRRWAAPKRQGQKQTRAERRAFAQAAELDRAFNRAFGND